MKRLFKWKFKKKKKIEYTCMRNKQKCFFFSDI